MTIYSYIDTLLESWCEWNDIFMTSDKPVLGSNLNGLLHSTNSNNPSRAKEMYRIGLLQYELSKGYAAFKQLRENKNIQSDLGFLAALIYKATKINYSQIIKDAYHSLCAVFSIIQAENVNGINISINTIAQRLLDIYPCPDDKYLHVWLRYILSAFYCDFENKPQEVFDLIIGRNNNPLHIVDEKSNRVLATFYNSEDVRNAILRNVTLTGIIKQKSALFAIGLLEKNSSEYKGFYGKIFISKNSFLRAAYEFEFQNLLNSPFKEIYCDRNPDTQINNALYVLQNIATNNNNYFSIEFSNIMKSIETGAIEALSHITNEPIDFFYKKLGKSSEDSDFILQVLAAIRTKPFVLLAGISGTGKSRIVRKLAQATVTRELQNRYDPESIGSQFNRWALHKPANFELIQVKPNWHNSMEVVGYKSNIGGAHYEFTPFIEFVARAWQHQNLPFFLCLDEMNLAPVEQYFAEYLSAIESQTIEGGKYLTDPIIKPFESFGEDVCNQMLDSLLPNVPPSVMGTPSAEEIENIKTHFKFKGLTLPRNLIVMGTVNMDETTFTFSRKVLDRAMSIVMNEVKIDDFFDGKTENDVPEMSTDRLQSLIDRPLKGLEVPDNFSEDVKQYVTDIDKVLGKTPFKLGYRALNEALLYVSAANMLDIDKTTALDQFTMMKILSRIEGDKRSIGDLLKELQKVITADFDKSNKKLMQMAETLEYGQFVSYWT